MLCHLHCRLGEAFKGSLNVTSPLLHHKAAMKGLLQGVIAADCNLAGILASKWVKMEGGGYEKGIQGEGEAEGIQG